MTDNRTGTIECGKCKKKFKYEILDSTLPGAKEREYARCPYCGKDVFFTMTNGRIQVSKVEDDAERARKNKVIGAGFVAARHNLR